jgi:hypothetical protein
MTLVLAAVAATVAAILKGVVQATPPFDGFLFFFFVIFYTLIFFFLPNSPYIFLNRFITNPSRNSIS